ncbi:uncharacterized protein F5147DRAFT_683437 [Suillus discolor]|uniref:Uncharacterized protein n=1 Tax=Suillus discolor TaxID=1912936 RepID=A0A9P7JWK5_9AGAM|nr:uncharacterized protein F5147DRAFT_683437 [Suillus discolor]KAG2112562.1 hypothetical protein F5147DRAFT_683437 [Suillus discolor]
MRHVCCVLHKLLALFRTMVIRLSRQTLHPYYVLQRIIGILTSRFMHSSDTHASSSTGRHRHQCSDADTSSVAILPSLCHSSESRHSAGQNSVHTRADDSLTEEAESYHVSVSITTSLQDNGTSLIIKPMTASDVQRYKLHPADHRQRIDTGFQISPGQKDFSVFPDKFTAGDITWNCQIHPHGTLYFSSELLMWKDADMETTEVEITVYTDADVREQSNSDAVASCVRTLLEQAQLAGHLEGILMELTVDLYTKDSGELECRYYFVAPDRRILFWEDHFEAKHLFGGVKGITSGHIKYAMEAEYWMHRELYPSDCKITTELHRELQAMILHAYTDTIFSEISLAPFDTDELQRALNIVDYLNGIVNKSDSTTNDESDSTTNDQYIWAYARLMRMFTRARLSNFYGEIGTRLGTDHICDNENSMERRPIVKLFNFVVLFGSPSTHVKQIDSVWVDQSVNRPRWKMFMNRLTGEWSGLAIYSTVMLAVDISFLAVPVIGQQTSAQIALYISSLCSVASLVVSALLAQSGGNKDSINRATAFMTRMTQSLHGKENLAIIFSLPYALVIWGMVFFFLALSLVIFLSADVTTWCTVGPAWLLVVGFIGWPVWAAKTPPIGQWMSSLWMGSENMTAVETTNEA